MSARRPRAGAGAQSGPLTTHVSQGLSHGRKWLSRRKEKMVEHRPLPDLLKPGVLSSPPAAVPTVPSRPAHATCGLLSLLPKTSITPSQPGDSLLPAPETSHLKGSSHSPLPPPHTIPILFLLLNLMFVPVPAWPTQHSEGAFPQCSRSFLKISSKYVF